MNCNNDIVFINEVGNLGLLGKDIISLRSLDAKEILYILETAETMKHVLNQKNKKAPHLLGKSVILIFYEKSSRIKLTFQLASQYLSAAFVDMSVSLGLENEGNLMDTGHNIEQMGGDFIIIRHPMSGTAKLLAENVGASVINAGDGLHEEPSQSLIELLTIKNQKKEFKGLNVAIIGDVGYNRVAKSNIFGLVKLGANVSVAAPPTLIPLELHEFGVSVYHDIFKATKGADVIMVLPTPQKRMNENSLPSLNEYKDFFKVDEHVLDNAHKDVIIMHPGSINRGIEISSGILDSKSCIMDDQISNGVAVQMALLYLLSLK